MSACFECGRETIGESCGFCGNDLCPACFEMGGGFCSGTHSQQMIYDYEDSLLGPEGQAERDRKRKAHQELVNLGILPK